MTKVAEAEEVVLQLSSRLSWWTFNPWYRDYWEDPQWIKEHPELAQEWGKKRERIVHSIERNAKYGPLMGKVVAKEHVGILSSEVIYETSRAFGDSPYEIVHTRPEGEVRITENTKVIIRLSV